MIRVKLLSHTPNPDDVVYMAARCCYDPVDMTEEDYGKDITNLQKSKLIKHLYRSGHTSTFEHASFTFAINGISRICSHQLVRHRLANFSQQSQRYITMNTDPKEITVVIPPSIKNDIESCIKFESLVKVATDMYKEFLNKGILEEDARYILPHSWETQLAVTMNARSLHNFFTLRLCKRSQWEIRELARLMLIEVKKVAPILFKTAGPSCIIKGKCEEASPCGDPYVDINQVVKPFLD